MSKTLKPTVMKLNDFDPTTFARACVGCLVLSRDGKIILQQRDPNAQTFPGCLATFGGGIELNESPKQALIRELKEELGAVVKSEDVIDLGAVSDKNNELIYVYFWHDKSGTITGCYEGEAKYYNDISEAEKHPKIMEDVRWLFQECKKRKLL